MASSFKIIFDAYCKLTATRVELQDNSICDQSLFRLLDAHYPTFKNTFGFTQALLVWALSAYAPPIFHSQNEHGIFIKQFRTSCPYDGNNNNKRRRVTYFYRQWNGKLPAEPPEIGKTWRWWTAVEESKRIKMMNWRGDRWRPVHNNQS